MTLRYSLGFELGGVRFILGGLGDFSYHFMLGSYGRSGAESGGARNPIVGECNHIMDGDFGETRSAFDSNGTQTYRNIPGYYFKGRAPFAHPQISRFWQEVGCSG